MNHHSHYPNYVKYVLAASDPWHRERLSSAIVYNGPDGCWDWQGTLNEEGYGLMRVGSLSVLVHRLALHIAKRPVPAELTVDHLCRNKRCVNPAHLEAVTGAVNTLRGNSAGGINLRKTHCIHGHEFTPENITYIKGRTKTGRPQRSCRQCARDRYRRKVDAAKQLPA